MHEKRRPKVPLSRKRQELTHEPYRRNQNLGIDVLAFGRCEPKEYHQEDSRSAQEGALAMGHVAFSCANCLTVSSRTRSRMDSFAAMNSVLVRMWGS